VPQDDSRGVATLLRGVRQTHSLAHEQQRDDAECEKQKSRGFGRYDRHGAVADIGRELRQPISGNVTEAIGRDQVVLEVVGRAGGLVIKEEVGNSDAERLIDRQQSRQQRNGLHGRRKGVSGAEAERVESHAVQGEAVGRGRVRHRRKKQ